MNHIKQNDKGLLQPIQKIGCFFRSCGLVAEYKLKKELTCQQINDAWLWAKAEGHIDKNDDVIRSAPIINHFMELLNSKGKFIEVGTFKFGRASFYSAIPEEKRKIDAVIQKILQDGPSGTHFRLVDKKGELIEDPHEPQIKVKAITYSILYHYIGVKK